jgi:hypothetical protein
MHNKEKNKIKTEKRWGKGERRNGLKAGNNVYARVRVHNIKSAKTTKMIVEEKIMVFALNVIIFADR